MFANRLRKNLRHLGRWARREEVTCWRVYDADLPEYAVAVDRYEDAVHVQEYQAPQTVDPERAEARLRDAMAVVPSVLEVDPAQVFLKVRRRQRGPEQYGKQAEARAERVVREAGCRFLVNLSDYLDTGLFLDHRRVRALVAELGRGRDFLNLFAYTGTATVMAARGGARSTTSVDLSNTYLEWARRNLELNGLGGAAHRLVREDCMRFLDEERRRYGLVFVAPPTFSADVLQLEADGGRVRRTARSRGAARGDGAPPRAGRRDPVQRPLPPLQDGRRGARGRGAARRGDHAPDHPARLRARSAHAQQLAHPEGVMPEYPDVTVYVEALGRRVIGGTLDEVRLGSPFLLRTVTPRVDELEGRRVVGVERVGKRIAVGLEGERYLVIHLMVAGRLRWRERGAKVPGRIGLAAFDFSSGTLLLTEASTRKRAALHLLDGRAALEAMRPPGVEVMEADVAAFRAALTRESHTVKRALTDPRLVSGIGNAYSDEILHRARLSPVKLVGRIDGEEMERLHRACREVLAEWTERLRREAGEGFPENVTAFRPEMAVHGKHGQPCPTCGAPVQRIVHAENESNYCARCQTGGKLLADRALSRLLKGDWPRTLEELEERTERLRSG
jgi:formamidopyrimidine-DNA glycosylase